MLGVSHSHLLFIQLLSPLREVGSLGRVLPTTEVSILSTTQRLLGSNLSEKPPVFIGGWGSNDMAGGHEGKGQWWLGGRGILGSNAQFNCTVCGKHQQHIRSPVASSGFSYASVVKGNTGQADGKKKDKVLMTQKADRLAHILATLPESDPLRKEFQNTISEIRANRELGWTQPLPNNARRNPRFWQKRLCNVPN